MNASRATAVAALLAAILCVAPASVPPAGAAVTLRFTPADTTVMLGASAHLSVWLDEPLEVRTVEVWVGFDPALLTSLGGSKGQLYAGAPCYIWEGFELTAPDTWHGYAVAIGSTCWVTGPGELYRWNFRGDAGGLAAITTVEARLFDPRAILIADVTLPPTTVRVWDPAVTAAPDPTRTPGAPALGVWPNPFNPRTLVSPAVSAPGPARVEAFDLRGRSAGLVWEGWAEPGMGPVPWLAIGPDGRRLAAGLYILCLRDVSGRTALARAILAK
ncbi:MAG: hypothetical protein ACYDIE_01295 [Candidatus Krumholzibacteriia bacterium]